MKAAEKLRPYIQSGSRHKSEDAIPRRISSGLIIRVTVVALAVFMVAVSVSSLEAKPAASQPVSTFELTDIAVATAISPNGSLIAVGFKGGQIDLVERETGKVAVTLKRKRYSPTRLKFSDDGNLLLCESGSGLLDGTRTFDVWRIADRKLLTESLAGAEVPTIKHVIAYAGTGDLSPDGKFLLLGGNGLADIARIDLAAGRISLVNAELPAHRKVLYEVEVSPGGDEVVFIVLDGDDNEEKPSVAVLGFPDLKLKKTYVLPHKFVGISGSNIIAACSSQNGIRFYNLATDKLFADIEVAADEVDHVVVSHDGKQIAVASNKHDIGVWSMDTGKLVMNFECRDTEITAMAMSHDGKLMAVTSNNKTLTLWRIP